jgi:hypothetical protein
MSGDVWLGLVESECVGPWFGPGLPDLPVKGGSTRALRITSDMMTLGIDSHVGDAARFSELAVGRRHRRVERLHAFARLLTRGQGLVPAP